MNKTELRKKYIELRKNIDEKKREKESKEIVNELNEMISKGNYDAILLYAPLEYEVDVFSVFSMACKDACEKSDCKNEAGFTGSKKSDYHNRFCFPRVKGSEMEFYYVNSESELETGSFNVREPKESCELFIPQKEGRYLIAVPGVCFDKAGFRLGYGKGFYDKYLSKYKDINFEKIGVCFKDCYAEKIENESTDIPVDKVIISE